MKHLTLIIALLWALGASGQIFINSYRFGAAPSANLLLDDYPNAAAAYSLRKLRTAYTGNCVEVRRVSDGTTSNIGFLNNYLDTVALKTFCASTDCFVRTWYDQSTFGRNVAQTTNSRQPQIVSSGALMYDNGDPAIYFTNAPNALQFSLGVTLNPPVTTFTVSTFESGGGSFGYLYDQGTQDYILTLSSGSQRIYNGANLTGNVVSFGTNYLQYALFNTTSSVFTVNNTSYTGSTGTRVGGENIVLGSEFSISATVTYFKGYIHEFVTYHSDQSANQANIRANINSFYNVY